MGRESGFFVKESQGRAGFGVCGELKPKQPSRKQIGFFFEQDFKNTDGFREFFGSDIRKSLSELHRGFFFALGFCALEEWESLFCLCIAQEANAVGKGEMMGRALFGGGYFFAFCEIGEDKRLYRKDLAMFGGRACLEGVFDVGESFFGVALVGKRLDQRVDQADASVAKGVGLAQKGETFMGGACRIKSDQFVAVGGTREAGAQSLLEGETLGGFFGGIERESAPIEGFRLVWVIAQKVFEVFGTLVGIGFFLGQQQAHQGRVGKGGLGSPTLLEGLAVGL